MKNERPRLLIVDDEVAHVEAILRAFEEADTGFEIESAGSLREFQAAVLARPPALAMIDLNLPDGRAVEVLTHPPENAPFPILVMTAFGNQQIVVDVMRAGALDYVVKSPAAFATMPRTVERALREWELLQRHKRAEAALRESEARLLRAQTVARLGNWELSLASGTMWASEEAFRIYGLERSSPEMPLAVAQRAVVAEDRPRMDAALRALLRSEGPYDEEFRIVRANDGALRVIHTVAALERDAGGRPIKVAGTIQDVTERRLAEEMLREREEQFRAMFEMASIGMAQADPHTGQWVRVNQKMCAITGYTADELLRKQVPELTHPDDRQKDWEAFQRVVRGEAPDYRLEKRYVRKDGSLAWVNVNMTVIRDAGGRPTRTMATIEDITERKHAEEQNRQTVKMEAVGRLAGGVAHDFNNKLQIILGCTEVILGGLPPENPIRGDIEEIRTAAHRSADLTRQLLTFSRKQTIAPVVLDVNVAISGSLKMLGRLIGENIRLNFSIAPDGCCVLMDPSQLDQIMANLAINARDAIAGTGTISIEAANRTLGKDNCLNGIDAVTPGDYVVLTLRDDGAGMTPEVQQHIFEPFFTTKGSGKGTGLGLATVYGIVKQNNGAITVRSAPGQGTVFTIFLPRSSAATLETENEGMESAPTGTETILLVEDEEGVLNLVRRTLEQLGYKVLSAGEPHLGLRVCTEYPETIHLLLTDVIMPDLSGKALAEQIRALRPGIRLLFMSGYTADIMEQQGHLPPGQQVLQKPFTGAELAQRVRETLDA